MPEKKICYFDVETTGIDPESQDIIQFAYIIEIDGVVKKQGGIYMQPFVYETISPKALEVNGITIEQIKTFDSPEKAHRMITQIFGRFINKYDKNDKFYPAGYNVDFDLKFLHNFFKKNHDNYFGSWFNWHKIDPLQILYFLEYTGKIDLPDYKLATVCKHFGIELDAHEAGSDITATRQLIKLLQKEYFNGKEKKGQ